MKLDQTQSVEPAFNMNTKIYWCWYIGDLLLIIYCPFFSYYRGESGISIPLGDPNQLNEFLSDQGGSDHTKHHGDLHYLFDAAMPFLQVRFCSQDE